MSGVNSWQMSDVNIANARLKDFKAGLVSLFSGQYVWAAGVLLELLGLPNIDFTIKMFSGAQVVSTRLL